jgi:hypothetical protein
MWRPCATSDSVTRSRTSRSRGRRLSSVPIAQIQLTARSPTSIAFTQLMPNPGGFASIHELSCASSSVA